MAEQPAEVKQPEKFDAHDAVFYAGLILLFAGLCGAVSFWVACAVIGAILTGLGLATTIISIIGKPADA